MGGQFLGMPSAVGPEFGGFNTKYIPANLAFHLYSMSKPESGAKSGRGNSEN